MRRLAFAAAALVAVTAPAPAASANDSVPATATDWSQRIETTAEGGYRMGSPDAPVKLVEFLSLTCGHCATFAGEALPELKSAVKAGRVSVEYRNYVLDHYDLAAAALSRCARPERYFALTEALLADQPQWAAKIEALTPAQRAELEVSPTPASVRRTAALLGLDKIAARHGVSKARAQTCLSKPERLEQLIAMIGAAEQLGINGTPSFMLNGAVLGPQDWTSLRPLLAQP